MTWFDHWLAARGISYLIAYQPASHYWLIQALLGAIMLTLAVLTGCGTILLSQRGGRPTASNHRQAAITQQGAAEPQPARARQPDSDQPGHAKRMPRPIP
jgi:hypothetical protein